MLEKDNFFVNRFWIIKEVVSRDLFGHSLSVLDLLRSCPNFFDVVEVEEIWVCDDLCRVIE